jgi:transposase
MTLTLVHADDRSRLQELVARESNATQRDRYRAVLLVLSKQLEGDEIAQRLGRSARFVDEWAGRYRRGGIAALRPRRQPGRRPKLTAQQAQQLKQRIDAGPREEDGVCALRGKDIIRIIEQEFGVVHTLGGIYDVLKRLGYASLVPRPRHRKNDPMAMQRFTTTDAPLLPAR